MKNPQYRGLYPKDWHMQGQQLQPSVIAGCVAMASKCIPINWTIWHLLKNSSFKPVFCSAGFYAKVHLSLYCLFYPRLHLLPTASWLYVETLLKRGTVVWYYLFSFVFFSRLLFNWLWWLCLLESKVQYGRNSNLESQTMKHQCLQQVLAVHRLYTLSCFA